MRIGIDVSQLSYPNTGVANYLTNLVKNIIENDQKNDYVLFYSSFRNELKKDVFNFSTKPQNLTYKLFKFPPTFLDFLWNRLHIIPIESLIGDIDVFISSDWTEPPVKKAKKATILYDLVVYKYPEESVKKIIDTQKRKLKWVKKESGLVICISESTKKDAESILNIPSNKLTVTYPGIN